MRSFSLYLENAAMDVHQFMQTIDIRKVYLHKKKKKGLAANSLIALCKIYNVVKKLMCTLSL